MFLEGAPTHWHAPVDFAKETTGSNFRTIVWMGEHPNRKIINTHSIDTLNYFSQIPDVIKSLERCDTPYHFQNFRVSSSRGVKKAGKYQNQQVYLIVFVNKKMNLSQVSCWNCRWLFSGSHFESSAFWLDWSNWGYFKWHRGIKKSTQLRMPLYINNWKSTLNVKLVGFWSFQLLHAYVESDYHLMIHSFEKLLWI